jgi:prepilin-type N-terminal cleavage/methylation domain-containing protein
MKIDRNKRAFTLIEILIATTIFVTVMVITIATISSSMNYQDKLKEIRTTSEGVQRIADMITRDVRATKGGTTLKFQSTVGDPTVSFSKGILLLSCRWNVNNNCQYIGDSNAPDTNYSADTLVLFSQKTLRIYSVKDGAVYYYLNDNLVIPDPLTSELIAHMVGLGGVQEPDKYKISSNSDKVMLLMGGFAPSTSAATVQQPYLSFKVISQTVDYDKLPSGMRARAEIDSSVTMRSYH